MTTDKKDELRLHHIIEAIKHIADFIDGVSKAEFRRNYEKQSAVIRQFEIIGEAASKITSKFARANKVLYCSNPSG